MPPSSVQMLATVSDLEARVGTIPTAEQARATACIQDASGLVLREAGAFLATPAQDNFYDPYWGNTTQAWYEPPQGSSATTWTATTVPQDVWAVVLAVAGRVYRNPEGLTSQSVGPISESWSPTSISPYLTEWERQVVRRAAGISGVASVRVRRDDAIATGAYLYADGSNEPISWFPAWDWQ